MTRRRLLFVCSALLVCGVVGVCYHEPLADKLRAQYKLRRHGITIEKSQNCMSITFSHVEITADDVSVLQDLDYGPPLFVSMMFKTVRKGALVELDKLTHLQSFAVLAGNGFNDEELKQLKFSSLVRLQLLYTDISENGVASIQSPVSLKELSLKGAWKISSLSCLRSFTELETLDVSETSISDNGLEGLLAVPKLKVLYLRGIPLSNDVFNYLDKMPLLEVVYLGKTNVTADGVKSFEATHPKIRVDLTP